MYKMLEKYYNIIFNIYTDSFSFHIENKHNFFIKKQISEKYLELSLKHCLNKICFNYTLQMASTSKPNLNIFYIDVNLIDLSEYFLGLYRLNREDFFESIYSILISILDLKSNEYVLIK